MAGIFVGCRQSPRRLAVADGQISQRAIDAGFRDQSKDYLDSVKAAMYDVHVPITCNVQQGAAPASWIVTEAEKEEGNPHCPVHPRSFRNKPLGAG